MPKITLPSEQAGTPLSLDQGEANYALFRAPVSKTIVSDVLTVEGTGRYTVLPQSGTADQITSIVISQEALNGTLIELSPETIGHTITLVHGTLLKLAGGINVDLTTTNSTIWLRHRGSGLLVQAFPFMYVPQ